MPPWSDDDATRARADAADLAAITDAGIARYALGAGWAWDPAPRDPAGGGRWRKRDPGLLWQSFACGPPTAPADPLGVARAVHAVARCEGRSERDAAWMLARVSRAVVW